jgi:dTDP-4-dehydrorhamnose reductase
MWLLVGGDSEIATATFSFLRGRGRNVTGTTRRRQQVTRDRPFLDLSSPLAEWEPPAGTTAACILAAVTRLAACEADPIGSAALNVGQTVALVDRLVARGIYVLFISTNQVFDGTQPRVAPEAPTCPISEYGRQKASTEAALNRRMASGAPIAILRLAKIVSPSTALLRGWTNSLAQREPIDAFFDMTMAPTPVHTVASAVEALLAGRMPGVFQLSGPTDISYAEFGLRLAARMGVDRRLVRPSRASSANLPTGANPRYTTLNSDRLRAAFGIAAPDLDAVIDSSLLGD